MRRCKQVLLDENNKAYVADIGMGKMLAGQDAIASAATFFWASPEQLQVTAVSHLGLDNITCQPMEYQFLLWLQAHKNARAMMCAIFGLPDLLCAVN